MRVTRAMLNYGLDQNLSKAVKDLDSIHTRMASGKNYSNISESPADAIVAIEVRRAMQAESQYKSNMENARTTLVDAETALSEINDILKGAMDISIRGASETISQSDRKIMANTVEHLMDRLVFAGNTKTVGQYIFSGFETDKPPFEVVGNELTYNGQSLNTGDFTSDMQEVQYIDMGRGLEIQSGAPVSGTAFALSIPGCEVMGTGADNLYTILDDLKTALEANDTNSIQSSTQRLQDGQDKVLYNIATVGERQNYLNTEIKRLDSMAVNRAELLSNIEDIDLAQGTIELKKQEMAYTVLLNLGAQMQLPTLAEFLR